MYLSGDVLRTNGVSAVVVDDGTDADPFESDPEDVEPPPAGHQR